MLNCVFSQVYTKKQLQCYKDLLIIINRYLQDSFQPKMKPFVSQMCFHLL